MSAKAVGPLTGILFVILVIVAFVVGGETPGIDDSAEEIVDFYLDNDDSQQLASALLALGSVALIFFLGSLRRALRAAAGDEGGLSTVALIGGVVIAIGASIFAGIGFTLGDAADELPAEAIITLNALNSDMFFTVAVGTAVFNLALGLGDPAPRRPPATPRVDGARDRHHRLDAARVLRLPGHGNRDRVGERRAGHAVRHAGGIAACSQSARYLTTAYS